LSIAASGAHGAEGRPCPRWPSPGGAGHDGGCAPSGNGVETRSLPEEQALASTSACGQRRRRPSPARRQTRSAARSPDDQWWRGSPSVIQRRRSAVGMNRARSESTRSERAANSGVQDRQAPSSGSRSTWNRHRG
jgi:hypothetical protein